MRTLLLVGSLAAGILFFVYEWYNSREQQESDHQRGHESRTYSAEDFIEINETTPKEVATRLHRKPPGPDENCSICLDPLMKKDDLRKYCIIALPKCGHWFHQRCAIRLLDYHPQCPVCRVDIDKSALRSTPVRIVESGDAVSVANGDESSNPNPTRNDTRHKKD